MYANENEGSYPQNYQILVDTGMLVPKTFRCSHADSTPNDLNACYKYIAGQGEWVPDENVIIYESPECHDEKRVAVAFANGQVYFLNHDEMTKRVQQTRDWLMYNSGPQPPTFSPEIDFPPRSALSDGGSQSP